MYVIKKIINNNKRDAEYNKSSFLKINLNPQNSNDRNVSTAVQKHRSIKVWENLLTLPEEQHHE